MSLWKKPVKPTNFSDGIFSKGVWPYAPTTSVEQPYLKDEE